MQTSACELIPSRKDVHIVLAHVAYRLGDALTARKEGLRYTEVRSLDALTAAIPSADVLVISGLWRDELLAHAPRLRLIQSIGAGTDQFPRQKLSEKGIKLASAQGVNERAVSEHAMGLILALARQLPSARDNQAKHAWRGMIADPAKREVELGGKTLVIVGFGRIGSRLARLAKAFDMRVIGVKRSLGGKVDGVDEVVRQNRLLDVLPQADYVALTCPLTEDTTGLIGTAAFTAMNPAACLINVARGRVVDEAALIETMNRGRIAGAALDCVYDEPLPAASPLWDLPNVFITPHTAGETQKYESNVIDVLLDNLGRLWSGATPLRNEIV